MMNLFKKWWTYLQVKLLKYRYRGRPYSEYYAAVMRVRTAYDPQFAVGGRWEEIGSLQFTFLKARGLEPHHKMLDFGCGSLRGGLHFIRYLDPGGYLGVDISAEALAAGKQYLEEAGLTEKQPTLELSGGLDLAGLEGRQFDYILAQSVLTHMPLEDIETLFQHIPKIMHPQTVFYATYFDGGSRQFESADRTNFHYPFETLRLVGSAHGLEITRDEGYQHPRSQQMLAVRVKGQHE
jgi:cyclopropane fatty-acyl-phospholipid synthase-like methyltransferase